MAVESAILRYVESSKNRDDVLTKAHGPTDIKKANAVIFKR